MRDNDIIYSANAPLSELQKFFTLVGSVTSPTIGGVVVTQGVGDVAERRSGKQYFRWVSLGLTTSYAPCHL